MPRQSFYRYMATSDELVPRLARGLRRGARRFTLPAPRIVVRPLLWGFLAGRFVYHFAKRVFVCEPLFKAYCESYGRNLRTGTFVHWVQGKGAIVLGDDCLVDGKSTFTFAHRYADRPVLQIGDHTAIGHDCTFIVGKRITIGSHCLISGQVMIFDSSGHHSEILARRARLPPPADQVREVTVGDDVWIGARSIIFPGVRIGAGSIVSAGSVVRTHVPPCAVVAGNPARVVLRLSPPADVPQSPVR